MVPGVYNLHSLLRDGQVTHKININIYIYIEEIQKDSNLEAGFQLILIGALLHCIKVNPAKERH
ncbi:MAG: hypothetical protein AMS27_01515 [Bacteroides sp. SM23_62_1]|nr:MAG: hypothetical protein AMS27_01515 [Bacteroides sp. SM23_62_1]